MAKFPRDPYNSGSNLERAIKELASDLDSPASLRILSGVKRALAPRQAAVEQVIDAMATRLREGSSTVTDASVTAAIAHWEKVCECTATADDVARFSKDAAEVEARRHRQPPPIETIVTGLAGKTDVGYAMGLHLQGLHGTWHRLWGMVILCICTGGVPAATQPEVVSTGMARTGSQCSRTRAANARAGYRMMTAAR